MRLTKVTFVSPIEAPDGGSGIHRKDFSEPGYLIEQDGAVTIVTHKQSGGRVVTNIPGFGTPATLTTVVDDAPQPTGREVQELVSALDAAVSPVGVYAEGLAEPFSDPSDTQTGTPKAKRGRSPKGGV